MPYQVIARKYRPQKFSDVVGQEAIVTTLKNSLIMGRVAHAYLFSGSRGIGKTTLARIMAKAIHCDQRTADGEPCCHCISCQAIAGGRYLDVLEIDGASHRGIDDIRQINETVGYAAAHGKGKIYIIDEVHMLTKEAFNALLKILEEPPEGVNFLFATTEVEKIPETVISRCQRFDLKRLSEERICSKLQMICNDVGKEIEESALHLLARHARGGLRDAESLLDRLLTIADRSITNEAVAQQLGFPTPDLFFQLDQHCHKTNIAFALDLLHLHPELDPLAFLGAMAEHYRILIGLLLDPNLFEKIEYSWFNSSIKTSYRQSAALYTTEQCLFILEEIIDWLQKIGKSPYPHFALEVVLMNILRSKQRIPLDAIIAKFIHLEKEFPEEQREQFNTSDAREQARNSAHFQQADHHQTAQNSDNPSSLSTELPSPVNRRYETLMRFAAVELEGSLNLSLKNYTARD